MPYYYFHLCKDSRIVAHDMMGRDCENDEAALQHAQDRGSVVTPITPTSSGSDCYGLKVRNETGKDIAPLPLPSPRSGHLPNGLPGRPTMQPRALNRSALAAGSGQDDAAASTTALVTEHRKNLLLAALEPEDLALLEPDIETVEISRGQVLYDTGDLIHHAYFPHDSIISLVNVLEDGSSTEVAGFGYEGVMGLLSGLVTREAFGRYVVVTSGSASRIPVELLNEVRTARPRLRQLIRSYSEALLAQTFQTVSCNAVHGVEARCCRWILSMHDRLDRNTLPLTHEFMAEMLGVQRSTLSAVTYKLQTAGLIRQSRGGITVIDRTGLEQTACECYGKVRRIYERLLPATYPRAPAQ
jgi:CRP-like cAMP-binding protein